VPTDADEEPAQKKAAKEEAAEQHGGMTLPLVHTRLPVPHVGMPAASSVPGRVLWLGGLGTLAVFGALDWPVAVAIAAGAWVAEQRAREQLRLAQAAPVAG
jgi:hypothetical protein